MGKDLVHEIDYWYYYALSVHWAISQFHGSSDVFPTSLGERAFANCALLFAFIVATWIVSGLTSSMTRLDLIAGKAPAQLSVLKRFLRCHGISEELALRVQLHADHMLQLQKQRIPESEVELLNLISEPVRKELHFEMHSPVLMQHPLFNHYTEFYPSTMRKICHSAISWVSLTVGDVVFCAGERPLQPQMLIPTRGKLSYLVGGRGMQTTSHVTHSVFCRHDVVDVFPNEWICEGSLWAQWIFRGELRAVEDCEVLAVEGESLQDIAKTQKGTLRKYAIEYVQELNRLGTACTDLGRTIDSNALVQRAFRHTLRSQSQSREDLTSSASIHDFRQFLNSTSDAIISKLYKAAPSSEFSRVKPA